MEFNALVFQSALNAMPPHVHNMNFILLLDTFHPIHIVRHPRLGLTFLQTFMKCCPDRLKQAVMVTGTTGLVFYNIAKKFAPKSLVDKIKVVKSRSAAGRYMIEKDIVGNGQEASSSHTSRTTPATVATLSSSSTTIDRDHAVPTFLGGQAVHEEVITKSIPLMMANLRNEMK